MTPRTLWMIFPACQPRTAGSATYAKILIPYLLNSPSVRSILIVAETAKGAKLIERDGRCTFFRLIPDSDKFETSASFNRIWRIFSMGIAQVILSVFLFAALFRRRQNIIHVHDAYARGVVPTLIKLFGLNAVCDVRDPFFFPECMTPFSAVIACSMNLVNRLVRHLPAQKISHIPVPLDFESLRNLAANPLPSLPVNGDYILYLGRSSQQKGIYELIEAYAELCAAVPSSSPLLLAGRVLIPDAQAIAMSHPGVFFIDEVAWNEVPAIISKARLVILPSKAEGVPRSLLEAIALGIPVLCPPGIAEFERYCPQCVLPEISPMAISRVLLRPPEDFIAHGYPISEHDVATCLARTAAILGV